MLTEIKIAAPLKVERSTVTKLVITGAANLDPINVFLEDLAPRKGKITVICCEKGDRFIYWLDLDLPPFCSHASPLSTSTLL